MVDDYYDLVQGCGGSSASAMELLQSCVKPSVSVVITHNILLLAR